MKRSTEKHAGLAHANIFFFLSNVNLVYSTYSKSGLDGVLQAETLC